MKYKIRIIFFLTLLGLQGCTGQIVGAATSATVAVATIPVKMSAAAASAATNTVIDRIVGK